mgnify:CR=1 FL=1
MSPASAWLDGGASVTAGAAVRDYQPLLENPITPLETAKAYWLDAHALPADRRREIAGLAYVLARVARADVRMADHAQRARLLLAHQPSNRGHEQIAIAWVTQRAARIRQARRAAG